MIVISQNNSNSLVLSRKELIFLCSLAGAESIIGIDDPFIAYTHEELDKEFEKIKENLENRGLIECIDDKAIRININILSAVNDCCSSDVQVIIEKISKSCNERFIYYATFHSVISLRFSDSTEDLLLNFIPTTADVQKEICLLIPAEIPDEQEDTMMLSSISCLEFESFIKHKDINFLHKCLENRRISDDEAKGIFDTLINPIEKISMISLEKDNYNRFDGNGILIFTGNNKSILTMLSEKEDKVELYIYCNNSVAKAVDKIIQGITRTHLYKSKNILNFVDQLFSHSG